MMVTSPTATSTAPDVLALSKVAWRVGVALSKLDQETSIVDTTVKDLAREVKSLGNECDLICAELEAIVGESATASTPPLNTDDGLWTCLASQVAETSRTMLGLETFIRSVQRQGLGFVGQAQLRQRLDESKGQIAIARTKVHRHGDNLHIMRLLINTVLVYITPCRTDWRFAKELAKLQDMVERLQRSLDIDPQPGPSHTQVTLMQCVREFIVKGATMYEAGQAAEAVNGSRKAADNDVRVFEWVNTLESMRRDQQRSDPSDIITPDHPSTFARDDGHSSTTSATCLPGAAQDYRIIDLETDVSDDDLDTDLAKAALTTGTAAFEAQEWEEADSLLQEALQVLKQLPKQRRVFCDIFDLQFKLAVCAYHTQRPIEAEEALMSIVQQTASSDEQRRHICDAIHLLSQLYIHTGQVDRARAECEKALQARRRLLGKQSEAALESTALMAHIYSLLNCRARAKSCIAMIPETRRDAILKTVEDSLGSKVDHIDSLSPLTRPASEASDLAVSGIQSRLSASSLTLHTERPCHGPVSPTALQSSAASFRQPPQRMPSNRVGVENRRSVTVASSSSAEDREQLRVMAPAQVNHGHSASLERYDTTAMSPVELPEVGRIFQGLGLSRKEILDKIGCQPRDQLEDAVCEGDQVAFARHLSKKKESWRSKLRKHVRPERVTALHFAALFGEMDMAQRLLGAGFNINEVPFGYSTNLTPLKFAVGARQVEMVEFLIVNGARPCDPESWSTLAGQLMNRSWLMKTASEAEREHIPSRVCAIMRVLLKHGWDVNAPAEKLGRTVLHQAVTFWTGSYRWDLNLRTVMTTFLCERGADPFKMDAEGKTPYDMASMSGHQELLLILDRRLEQPRSHHGIAELPGEPCGKAWMA